MKRFSIKITGQSGSGLASFGDILANALLNHGYYLKTDRDFPSLIKGGVAVYHIDISSSPIHSTSQLADIVLSLDEKGIYKSLKLTKKKSHLIEGFEFSERLSQLKKAVIDKDLKHHHLDTVKALKSIDATSIMVNTFLLAYLAKLLSLDQRNILRQLKEKMSARPDILKKNVELFNLASKLSLKHSFSLFKSKNTEDLYLLDSNKALALGALNAGLYAYYAYPMSPASSILKYLADTQNKTNIVIHQAEDEISAVQMVLGTFYTGKRAMTATSGGGFDLMLETISAAGIMETPLVCVLAQRAGAGTGLPTWTGQGDLNVAAFGGHGEFPRIVLAISDPKSAFYMIQEAFNLSEKYLLPVIILTEKQLAESKQTIKKPNTDKILQNLSILDTLKKKDLKSSDAYSLQDTRHWPPGHIDQAYVLNSDEHNESGDSSEMASDAKAQSKKRMAKMDLILSDINKYSAEIIGPKSADISFIGWGSTKNIMLDTISYFKKQKIKVNYLHYNYILPLDRKKAEDFAKNNKNIHIIEGNANAQLKQLLNIKTNGDLLKYDGRPFYPEELIEYINQNTKKQNAKA